MLAGRPHLEETGTRLWSTWMPILIAHFEKE